MKLPRGVTGFWNISDTPPEFINKSEIESLITKIEFPYLVNSKDLSEPDHSSNYWRIPVVNQIGNTRFDLLINSSYWFICAVNPDSYWMNLTFENIPETLEKQ